MIALLVLFFIIGFSFYICGAATAFFACQLASREGATGGSRNQIVQAARRAATRVATGPFGRFAHLENSGGGNFADGLAIRFFQVAPGTGSAIEFTGGGVNPAMVYEVRVESSYQLTVPFIGRVQGRMASDNVVDHPEALAL